MDGLHFRRINIFVSDAQSFLGEVDLWCTNQQFWEIGAGDEEEHATMLYNYLYYIMSKKKTSTSTSTTVAKNGEHLFAFAYNIEIIVKWKLSCLW